MVVAAAGTSTRPPIGPPPRLLPTPRVIKIRGKPNAFQLLDYEVGVLPGVRGVHARKLATLLGYEGFSAQCDTSVPALPARKPRWRPDAEANGLVSFGGQLARGSGAIAPALAQVAKARGSRLTFHTPPLPDWMRDAPTGHLAAALATGCLDLIEHETMASFNAAKKVCVGEAGFVAQGGAWAEAEPGVAALARAIREWWLTRPGGALEVPRRLPDASRGLDVVLPSGSGTCALFLARHLDRLAPSIRVYAVPCNGDAYALTRRMEYLDARTGGDGVLPRLLEPPETHAVRQGTVAAPLLASWRDASSVGVLLDLIYGPVAWGAMDACDWRPGGEAMAQRELLYVNTGGHEGLEPQMQRYARAGLLRRFETGRSVLGRSTLWQEGQWEVEEVIKAAERNAASAAGLVHTRDAGL